jgi:hypothetical protein
MKTHIYILIDPITNGVRYVGKANNPKERFKNHKNKCRDKNTHKRNWINKLRKLKLNPELEIIDTVDIAEWKYWEKFWISYFMFLGADLVNYTSGGDGMSFGNKTSFKIGDKSKSVVGYNSDRIKIYEFSSATAAANFFNLNRGMIAASCSKNNKVKTTLGIAWFYKSDLLNVTDDELRKLIDDRYKRAYTPNSGQYKPGIPNGKNKPLVVFDTYAGVSQTFRDQNEASTHIGVSQSAISWSIRHNTVIRKRFKITLIKN